MKKILKKFIGIIAILILSFGTGYANRPGGGHSGSHGSHSSHSSHSYSGGSHFYGGSSSSGGGSIFIWLLFDHPVLAIIAVYILYRIYKKINGENDDESETETPNGATNLNGLAMSQRLFDMKDDEINRGLNELLKHDPNFSLVMFKDFVYLLFSRFILLRGTGSDFNEIRPFFAPDKLTDEDTKDTAKYSELYVKDIKIENVNVGQESAAIRVTINSEFTHTKNGRSTRKRASIGWVFARDISAQTLEPQDVTRISCPCCGANEGFTDAGTCTHCGMAITPGKYAWQVALAARKYEDLHFGSTYLRYSGEDAATVEGTTNISKGTSDNMRTIASRSGISLGQIQDALIKNIRQTVPAIYAAWSENNLSKCRHLLTDRQYESMKAWTDYLESHSIRNRVDNVSVTKVIISDCKLDKFYDSYTCRVWIKCSDYMVNGEGKVVGGHQDVQEFSEYWTFVRRSGVTLNDISLLTCPSCGAPTDNMGQTGVCEYCNTKISSGKFSWVLSGIEQVC